MSDDERRSTPLAKALTRRAYSAVLGLGAIATVPFSGKHGAPRVQYGGAITGDIGGPLVKVKRLTEFFPEDRLRYNLIYALSNAPYLPDLALAILKRRGIPVVHNQNGVFYPAWYSGDWEAENARMARTYHQADYVFWQSAFCRRASDRFLGARSGPGEILYNAVDTKRFVPREKPLGGPAVFLMTGKMDHHLYYRVENALLGFAAAVQSGLDARLHLAGWMQPMAEMRARTTVARLGIAERVSFLGRYTQNEAPEVYRSAHVYVSTKHNDACPNAVIEAMACGLPVVYSASGGVPELVGDAGCGVPVPEVWDVPQVPPVGELTTAMLSAAARVAELAPLARARAVAKFDIGHWIDRHRAVFESLTR
jgi:glycosyltransferase involved in cell wall biosynthesis